MNNNQVDEIARLCEYTVDDVIPILEDGSFIPRYEPKQRDKYHKRREMTSDEKVQRRREQNRLASKRARLKKFNQKKFLRKVIDQLTRKQATFVKQLEILGINPNMYIDGVLSPSMEPSPKTVSDMNDRAKKLCERNSQLRDLLDGVSCNSSPFEDTTVTTATLQTTKPTTTAITVPKLLSIPPLSSSRGETENEPKIEKPESYKENPKSWPPYPPCPPAPAPTDCYSCAVTMGYGCAHCGHGVPQPTYQVHQQTAPPLGGFSYPSYPMSYYQPPPVPRQPTMSCYSPWPQQSDAMSNYAPGGYMGFSDAFMNSQDFAMDLGEAQVSQQYSFPPPHGF